MDKEQFKLLHRKLAKEFGTDELVILFIRSSMLELKLSYQQMIKKCLHKKRLATVKKQIWDRRLKFLLHNNLDTLTKITNEGPAPFHRKVLNNAGHDRPTERK